MKLALRAMVVTFVLLTAGVVLLLYLNRAFERLAGDLVLLSVFAVSHSVGALVASRRPANPVGWLLAASAYMVVVAFFCDLYVRYGLVTAPGSLPAAHAVVWLTTWPWVGMFAGVLFAALLFPDGRLPSRRWRPFAWFAAGFVAFITTVFAFAPTFNPPYPELVNPLGIPALAGTAALLESELGFAVFLILLSGSVLALIVRFRRSRGVERQQLKWVGSATGVALVGFLLGDSLPDDGFVTDLAFGAALIALPLSIGVAMLRYRLYDIDVLINRTLVYGALSAALLGTYALLVLALTSLLRPITGSGEIAVAGSTLVVLALFQPLRARIQRAVDRRFYRARYDAARTVDRFGARLREQVDLDQLRSELIGVVDETIKPAHASLWLRGQRW